ncbi:hypothetical protein DICVIV_07129 [Dictyocaulus viviparus]|uniref:KANL2-like probable zinc-finger domain-containing protein n=1 Tax=Dictyocaulus viviparus TaxID=29172 RepID=A0A0D8XQ86_DICVI|nr:hypothetical protein DICVIV_07129 [Dictyocaulus viviparus]
MGDVIDWAASEPPNRYVLAFGTSHCLVEQDYDHSVYGECAYIGSRTLIKCKAVRKKTDLKANGGICEMHKLFHDSIRNRFCCEDRRMMQDTGQGKPKYSPFLNHDGLICEEYYWLMPSHRWESPLSRSTFDYAPDDDMLAPLWNAGVYTDKDLLRLRKILSEKRVEYLKLHAEMIMERVRRKASDLFSKNGKLLTLGDATAAITAACSSIDEYGVITKRLIASRRCELERSDKSGRLQAQPLLCSFGKLQRNLAADNDRITVLSVLHSILDCIACNKEDFISYREIQDSKGLAKITLEVGSEKNLQCSAPAVPLTMFCISHQMLDERQLLFVPCSMCHSMCADIRSPPLCGKHLKDSRVKRVPMKDVRISASPAANFSTSSPISSISSKSKTFNDPSKPLFGLPSNSGSAPFISPSLSDRRGNKRISVDIQSKEEADELSKRFKTEAPPQLPLAESVSQGQTPAVIDAIRRAEMRRHKEEMCSCSRIRPFERSQFPPKSSLPRRINTANRLPLPVRRPFLVEGSSSQSQRPSYAAQIRRHAGSDTLPYRQLSGMSSRRSQPPHRVLLKDGSISSQYSVSLGQKPIGSTGLGLQSSSTFTAIDESGNVS